MDKREVNTFKDDLYEVIRFYGFGDERGYLYLGVMSIWNMRKPMENLMFGLLNSLEKHPEGGKTW